MLKFTTILHIPRKANNMSVNEYILCDMIHHLSNGRWCNMSKENMSEEIWLWTRVIYNMLEKLIKEGWIEKNDYKKLKTTDKWLNEMVYAESAEEKPKTLQKVQKNSAESADNIYNDNNNSNINITKWKTLERNNSIILSFKNVLNKHWLSYSNVKERIHASNLSRNAEWNSLLSTLWVTDSVLIEWIMSWTCQDAFWNGKISSLMQFYYKWNQLVNQMKKDGKFKFEDQAKKIERQRRAEEWAKQYITS